MTKKLDELSREQGIIQLKVNNHTPEDEHEDFDLGAAVGATFDYEKDKTQGYVKLSVAARMLCNLGDVEYQWRKGGKNDYDDVYECALNDIVSGKLNAKEKEGTRVSVLEWIQWAKQSGYPVPMQLECIQPGRERQKQVTANIKTSVQNDANRIAAKLKKEGRKSTKDAIIYELQKINEYRNMSESSLRRMFHSPRNTT